VKRLIANDDPKDSAPTLDFAEHAASPLSVETPLLPHDSLLVAVAKVGALESLLALIVRDCKFQEFMKEILNVIMRVIKSEAGSILELDHKNNTFFFRAVVGQSSDRVDHFIIPAGQGIVGYVAESGQPLVVHDVKENKIHLKSVSNAIGFEARNMIALPILIRGQVFGVLELLNRVGEHTFTPADVELLTYLCNMSARAIEMRLMIGWASSSRRQDKRDQDVA
jgi:GAF domain-containing protein